MKDSAPGTCSSVIDYATDVQASRPEPNRPRGNSAAKAQAGVDSNSGAPALAEKERRCRKRLGLDHKKKMCCVLFPS